eukprot:jgi/Ulvmu1/154/UM001_0158.1
MLRQFNVKQCTSHHFCGHVTHSFQDVGVHNAAGALGAVYQIYFSILQQLFDVCLTHVISIIQVNCHEAQRILTNLLVELLLAGHRILGLILYGLKFLIYNKKRMLASLF